MKNEILNAMDNQFMTLSELAQQSGTERTSLHKFLYNDTEIKFPSLVNIATTLFPETHTAVINKWCLQLEKAENMRMAMEFTALNNSIETLDRLIDKQEIQGRKNQQWAEVYRILSSYKKNEFTHEVLLKKLYECKTSEPELAVLLKLIEVYSVFQQEKFSVMFELAKYLEKQIEAIGSEYIRESYTLRLCEMFAHGYLAKNDVKKARHYANIVLNSKFCANLKAGAVYIVGMSFLFEDYDQCIANLEISDRLLSVKNNQGFVNSNVSFAKIFWGKETVVAGDDFSSHAHQLALAGDREKALAYLDLSVARDGDTIFKRYFKAVAKGSSELLWEVYGEFLSKGNLFFANLPRLMLQQLGENEHALNAYYKISIA